MSFIYALQATWNDPSVLYEGIALNISDGAAGVPLYAPGSNILDLKSNGVTKFSVDPNGAVFTGDRSFVNVKYLNAKGNGITDDTQAIINALNSPGFPTGGVLIFPTPESFYLVSSKITINKGWTLLGTGQSNCAIKTTSPTDNIFELATSEVKISGFYLSSTVQRTAPTVGQEGNFAYIKVSGLLNTDCDVSNCYIDGTAIGIWSEQAEFFCDDLNFQLLPVYGEAIISDGGGGIYGTNIRATGHDRNNQPKAGLHLKNSGNGYMNSSLFTICGSGLLVDPIAGAGVQAFFSVSSLYDNCVNGINIIPNNGACGTLFFDTIWATSCTENGVNISPTGSGVATGITFNNIRAGLNGINGVNLAGLTSDTILTCGVISQNANAGVNLQNGINNIMINDNRIGDAAGNSGNKYGILIFSGVNGVMVNDNNLLGNTTDNLVNSYVGININISDNLGYDTPWVSYSPAMSSATGAFGAYTLNSAAYQKNEKTIVARVDFTITNVGGASLGIVWPLPISSVTNGGAVTGQEIVGTGKALAGNCTGVNASANFSDGTDPIGVNRRYVMIATYNSV